MQKVLANLARIKEEIDVVIVSKLTGFSRETVRRSFENGQRRFENQTRALHEKAIREASSASKER